jgi:hypothetical protein
LLTLITPHAKILVYQAITDYFQNQADSTLALVRLTLFDEPTIKAFRDEWQSFGWEK